MKKSSNKYGTHSLIDGEDAQESRHHSLLPVNLIVSHKKTLVIGGGAVAARKIATLLQAGAHVSCICCDATDAVRAYAKHPQMSLHIRHFSTEDVRGMFLCYAATDTQEVNFAVVKACRAHGVLCGVVDNGWRSGDLTSPATFKYDDLTFAISSDGRACRISRALKRHLQSHLATCASATPIVLGFEHTSAPPLSHNTMHRLCQRLSRILGVCECMPLMTCSRTEIYAIATEDPVCEEMMRTLFTQAMSSTHAIYFHRDEDAFQHAARVAAGMRAQLPGETHIVAQLKKAYKSAADSGFADTLLRTFIDTILCVSKHIRIANKPYLSPTCIEELCCAHLAAITSISKETPHKIVIAGSGMIGRELARRLVGTGAKVTLCYHSQPPAISDENTASLDSLPLTELPDVLTRYATLICALRTDEYCITEALPAITTRTAPLTIIDLSVPPAVDPRVAINHPVINLYTLDDITAGHRITEDAHAAALRETEKIIAAHRHLYIQCKKRLTFLPHDMMQE